MNLTTVYFRCRTPISLAEAAKRVEQALGVKLSGFSDDLYEGVFEEAGLELGVNEATMPELEGFDFELDVLVRDDEARQTVARAIFKAMCKGDVVEALVHDDSGETLERWTAIQ